MMVMVDYDVMIWLIICLIQEIDYDGNDLMVDQWLMMDEWWFINHWLMDD